MAKHRVDENESERALSAFFAYGIFFVVFPVALLVGTYSVATDLRGIVRASSGAGTEGTFEATGERCARLQLCAWTGTFTPSDGSSPRTDVLLTAPVGVSVGESVPAVDTGSWDRVYSTQSNALLYQSVVYALLLIASWVGWAVVLVQWWRRRTKGPRIVSPPKQT
jgi:hypothetical protein